MWVLPASTAQAHLRTRASPSRRLHAAKPAALHGGATAHQPAESAAAASFRELAKAEGSAPSKAEPGPRSG
eukprot:6314700-Pyramimonas_sp.AAC.1